jgi:hypothetical protein
VRVFYPDSEFEGFKNNPDYISGQGVFLFDGSPSYAVPEIALVRRCEFLYIRCQQDVKIVKF